MTPKIFLNFGLSKTTFFPFNQMSQRLGMSFRIKESQDDEVIAKEIKILKMIGQLWTTTVNLFCTIVLANYSTSYLFIFGSKFVR